MLPSNGLKHHLSAKEYWSIYEQAEDLDCALGDHGGSYGDLGFNSFDVFPPPAPWACPFRSPSPPRE
jgi:hypothetical protein